ncbi:hypothetical protein HMPREF9555_00468 [Selenomonas artemidis F0399]|uniref:Uncharacterized protein n=1 Tax=Selenomonas artemidis F0399 TaxID=749551 RepID=E7N0G8_9FIRM|nr:hypothetical protein HMPREF9555_00468 [Selenomonas artemidis F0399]
MRSSLNPNLATVCETNLKSDDSTIAQKSRECNSFAAFGQNVRRLYHGTLDEICYSSG